MMAPLLNPGRTEKVANVWTDSVLKTEARELYSASTVTYPREVLKKAEEHSRHIDDTQTSVDLTKFISA